MNTEVKTELEARELHERVVEQTKGALYRWIVVIGLNLFTHFMRMAGSLSYMTAELGASELDSGVVITAHLTLVGLSNAYLSFSMDSHSFEAMITARFGLLTLLTLAEWLAPDFAFFAAAYVLASFAIIWVTVVEAYLIKMLPPSDAKRLNTLAMLAVRFFSLAGLALAGCIGGMISLPTIYLSSFIVSLLSLIYILSFVVGQESELKRMQKEKILPIYQAYPDLFPDPSNRFPIIDVAHSVHMDQTGTEMNNQIGEKDSYEETLMSVHFWLFVVFVGLRTAQGVEFIAWWNVYCNQVFDQNITLPSLQMTLSILLCIPAALIVMKLADTPHMRLHDLIHWAVIVNVLCVGIVVLMYLFWFPTLSFRWFWMANSLIFIIGSIPDPFRMALMVNEYPIGKVGLTNAVVTLSKTVIPAAQHIIIGGLWNQGGDKHPWFFRWFAILNACGLTVFICYYLVKKSSLRGQYETLP